MSAVAWLTEHRDWIGWIATSLFTLSFVVKDEINLLRLQFVAASVWLSYGVLLSNSPVIVANVLVAGGALYKLVRLLMSKKASEAPPPA